MEKHSFEVQCPHCGGVFNIENPEQPEITKVCPHCHDSFLIEMQDADSLDGKDELSSDQGGDEDWEISDSSNGGAGLFRLPASTLVIILLAVVAVFLAGIILFVMNSGHRAAVPPEQADLEKAETVPAESGPLSEPIQTPGPESDAPDETAPSEDEIGSEAEDFYPGGTENPGENHPDFLFPSEDETLQDGESSPTDVDDAHEGNAESPLETENEEEASRLQPAAEENTSEEVSGADSSPSEQRESGNIDGEQSPEIESFDVDTYAGGDMTVFFSAMAMTPSEPINISKRLDLSLRRVRLAHAGLADFIRVFYQLTAVPVELDWQSFPSPVPIWEKRSAYEASDLTASQFLEEFAAVFGLEVSSLEDRVCLGLPDSETAGSEKVTFDCSDLIQTSPQNDSSDPLVSEPAISVFPEILNLSVLENALRDLILDETLNNGPNAGKAEVVPGENSLTLSAGKKTIENAHLFFDRVRSLRHLPPKKQSAAEILIPENLCWENKLASNVSLSFLRPVPLSEALLLLEKNYQIHFFFDYASMAGGGAVLETPVKLIAADLPLERVLSELLSPLDLGYVVLTENLLAVTSNKAGDLVDAEIHFYSTPDEDIPLDEVMALAERVKKEVEPESWQTESISGGKIWIDPVSHSFYIRQTYRNQIKIRRLLQSGLVGKEISL